MKIKSCEKLLYKCLIFGTECFKGSSLLRTLFNMHFSNKEPFTGRGIDYGAKNASSRFYRFIDITNAEMTYTDLIPRSKKVKSIDFEKDFDLSEESYDFALLINTLEHVFNYQNFVSNINKSLVKGGILEGAVPFLHPYHKDPDDYFRYTHTALKKILEKANFEKVEITPICRGSFSVFASMISRRLKFKPLILLSWASALLLDLILNKISKNNLNIYGGLAFKATKK